MATSVQFFQDALTGDLNNFGTEDSRVDMHRQNLAEAYFHLEQFEEAQQLLEQTKANVVARLGIEHPEYEKIENLHQKVKERLPEG